ncbi:MAG TPA: hypothetical protein VGK59_19430 [Ohtaekwangia sp.]
MNELNVYRIVFILFFVLVCTAHLQAQSDTTQTLTGKIRSAIHSKSERLKTDSIGSDRSQAELDSLKGLASYSDSLPKINPAQSVQAKTDSLQRLAEQPSQLLQQKISGLKDKLTPGDSLKPGAAGAQGKLDQLEQSVLGRTDSVRQRLDSSISSVQDKVGRKVNDITNGKTAVPDGDIDIPAAQIPGAGLPDKDLPVSGLPATGMDTKLDLPATGNVDLPSVDSNVKVPDVKLPGTEQLGKVNEVTQQVKGIDGKLGQAEKYEKEIKDLKKDAPEKLETLPDDAEKRLADVDAVQKAGGELSKAEQLKAKNMTMVQQYRDKKLIMAEMKRKTANVVNDLFAQNGDKVKTAQDKLAKSKQDAMRIKSVKDIFKKRSSELDNKHFYQRLVPGITWQLYNTSDMIPVDLALQVGYRFTPSLTAGGGFIYRVGISEDFDHYVKGLDIYGSRGYVDLALTKGFFAHAEFETLKLTPDYMSSPAESGENRVTGSYFGLGKRFNLSWHLRGNLYGLYRVDYQGELPDVNKVCLRFGFEYMFKGRGKKKSP